MSSGNEITIAVGSPPSQRTRSGRYHGILIVVAMIAAALIASAWLVLPYMVEGRGLLSNVGAQVQDQRRVQATSIGQFLTRTADGPGRVDVDILYATPRYFEIADKARSVREYRPDRFLIFIVSESLHVGRLPVRPPDAALIVDGRKYAPIDVDGPSYAEHHRTTAIRFPRFDTSGMPLINEHSGKLELRLASDWDGPDTARTAVWSLPIDYPQELISVSGWTFTMLMAMAAGLLSAVLTPCLLQLVVIYLMTITGLSAADVSRSGTVSVTAGRRMILVAVSFVVAFMGLYTAVGALIGFVGKEAQLLFAEWSRSISVVAGSLVIGLGVWVGVRARAPIVCRIPMANAVRSFDRRGVVGSALVAAGFSLGCSACFGGAIIATLLIYVGALGSAPVGALVMFMFSIGVAIPFLLAAAFLSRMMPAMDRISRYAPQIGFISMVVIVAFGIVLITDNFHALSNLIYPWLGLS